MYSVLICFASEVAHANGMDDSFNRQTRVFIDEDICGTIFVWRHSYGHIVRVSKRKSFIKRHFPKSSLQNT